jgi:uroporphyrinogen-III decarboxylase
MKSKELFQALFKKHKLPRPLYIPLISSFAAKLRQISIQEMFSSPTIYANTLRDAYRLFGFDVLVTSFDPSLEAEALGCKIEWKQEDQPPQVVSHPLAEGNKLIDLEQKWEERGRLPIVLEVTKRLTMLLSKEIAIVGAITGPFTLARHLQGEVFFGELGEDTPYGHELLEFANQCCLRLAKLYAELRVDGIIIMENETYKIGDISAVKKLTTGLQPLVNLLHYFGIPLIMLAHGCLKEQSEALSSLPADGFILDTKPDEIILTYNPCMATTIPISLLLTDPGLFKETLTQFLNESKIINSLFFSTDWEVPYRTPVQNIHTIMEHIKKTKHQ